MSPSQRIGLIDYGAGNLLSVRNALQSLGVDARMVRSPDGLEGLEKLVLPGVGAFGDCSENLRSAGLWEPVRAWVAADRPYLGICLGYQILFEGSEECAGAPGLGVFPGKVVRFPARAGLKVPHMGWNEVRQTSRAAAFWQGIPDRTHYYFVHSFHPVPAEPALAAGWTDYAGEFAAAAASGRVWGVQFHPERSQNAGLRLLRNFLDFA